MVRRCVLGTVHATKIHNLLDLCSSILFTDQVMYISSHWWQRMIARRRYRNCFVYSLLAPNSTFHHYIRSIMKCVHSWSTFKWYKFAEFEVPRSWSGGASIRKSLARRPSVRSSWAPNLNPPSIQNPKDGGGSGRIRGARKAKIQANGASSELNSSAFAPGSLFHSCTGFSLSTYQTTQYTSAIVGICRKEGNSCAPSLRISHEQDRLA